MSVLGILHTIVSIIAIIIAFVAIFQNGKIDAYSRYGKYYSILTVVACISSFPLSKAGGFNPGHAIGILILALLAVVYFVVKENKAAKPFLNYVQIVAMSATLFLSFVPAVNETLSRLPVNNPIATGPQDPIVQKTVMILLVLFLIGVSFQLYQLKKQHK